jgi:hypothetical protein
MNFSIIFIDIAMIALGINAIIVTKWLNSLSKKIIKEIQEREFQNEITEMANKTYHNLSIKMNELLFQQLKENLETFCMEILYKKLMEPNENDKPPEIK